MSLVQKKYKRLLSELIYVNSEYEYTKDVLKEAHIEFEQYYQQFCKDHDIPIDELNKKHSERLKEVFPSKKPTVDEQGLVKQEKTKKQKEKPDKTLQKMYRKAATMTHPDKFLDSESDEALDAANNFRLLTSAFNEKRWAEFLDICQKLDILPNTYKKVTEIMKKEIDELKSKTDKLKMAFSWRLFECDNDGCKKKVIESFLKQLFGYERNIIVI